MKARNEDRERNHERERERERQERDSLASCSHFFLFLFDSKDERMTKKNKDKEHRSMIELTAAKTLGFSSFS